MALLCCICCESCSTRLLPSLAAPMFELVHVRDAIEITPSRFGTWGTTADERATIEHAISTKYLFKSLPSSSPSGSSLIVALVAIVDVGHARLTPGDPSAWVGVDFTLLTFRPVPKERLRATIRSQDSTGIALTVDFFDDFFVPAGLLATPSEYDVARRRWQFLPDEDDSSAIAPYNIGDEVIVMIHNVVEGAVGESRNDDKQQQLLPTLDMQVKSSPLAVYGSFAEPGLGPLAWFDYHGTVQPRTPVVDDAEDGRLC